MPVTHHELCFGCGLANLFGLQLELEAEGPDRVGGRFFVKQDHQGPPGYAHGGVIATALDEAMALLVHAAGIHALTRRLEVDLLAPVPVGSFATVSAHVQSREERQLELRAELHGDEPGDRPLARARGTFVVVA
ncbi:MAG TPA: PaaI family thioesterase [Thermoleophilaceae bacterium]